jgi:hypothetical protein
MPLVAALQHRMRGDQSIAFEDPDLVGEGVNIDAPLRVASGTL